MTDQMLTTVMIRMVNSAFYGLQRKVSSVRESIVYLGLKEIMNLVYSVSLANSFDFHFPLLNRVRFWEHAFGCALCSRFIARKVDCADPETAYLAGLLHDVGEAILALKSEKLFEKVVQKVLGEGKTFYAAEDEVYGINHTEFGPWLAEKWSLPPPLSDTIQHHHTPGNAKRNQDLVGIVRLADLICLYHKLDFGYPEGEALTSEIVSVWRFLLSRNPSWARFEIMPFLEEFNGRIEVVKQTVQTAFRTPNPDPRFR